MGLVTALIQALNADCFDVSFSLSLSLLPGQKVFAGRWTKVMRDKVSLNPVLPDNKASAPVHIR